MNQKNIYRISTALLTLIMLFSVTMYIVNHETIRENFTNLGYPTYLIYPLAAAKILGLIAIWSGKSVTLKQWAYAGFFFNFVLALVAHIMIADGQYQFSIIALVVLLISVVYDRKLVTI